MARLEDALEYPVRGSWLERTLYGSALVVGSILLVPLVVLAGYGVRVLETSLEGDDTPPTFDDRGSLFRRGAGAIGISLVYFLVPLLAGTLLALVLGIVGYYGLQALAPVVGGESELVWLVSGVAGLFTALVGLGIAGVTLLSWFCLPAGLVRYAQTGRIRAAVDRTTVWSLVCTREYLTAVIVLQLLLLAVLLLAVVAVVTIVGVLALPALCFLTILVSARVLGAFAAEPGTSQSVPARDAHLEQAAGE